MNKSILALMVISIITVAVMFYSSYSGYLEALHHKVDSTLGSHEDEHKKEGSK